MTTHVFGDTAVLTRRSLRHITRSPDTIITTTIMPIAFLLLFVYVFGGAINAGSDSYVTYLLPGILLITVASGISYTAFRLFLDLQGGIFERFQSLPIARPSVLWAHVLTSLVANLVSLLVVVGVALVMGFRSGAGVLAWLAIAAILILFTLALTWLAVIPGLTAKTAAGQWQPTGSPHQGSWAPISPAWAITRSRVGCQPHPNGTGKTAKGGTMDNIDAKRRRWPGGEVALGGLLVLLGLVVLLGQTLDLEVGRVAWPVFVIVPGLGRSGAGRSASGPGWPGWASSLDP